MSIPAQHISGLLLAGGQGARMGGLDKGLQVFRGEPLALHVLRRLAPQVGPLMISANLHLDIYRQFGYDVISDASTGFQRPLAGMHAGLLRCSTPWLLSAPCDSPFLPTDLAERLAQAVNTMGADLAYAVTGEGPMSQAHPVFSLMRASLRDELGRYLHSGSRQVRAWQHSVHAVAVRFADEAAFRNLNTIADLNGEC